MESVQGDTVKGPLIATGRPNIANLRGNDVAYPREDWTPVAESESALHHGQGHGSVQETLATPRKVESSPSPCWARFTIFWHNSWSAKIMSCLISLVAFICLVLVLGQFNGHVVTEMPLNISINTLVAIFSAIIKSALLLPAAEGISQLKWLWFSRTRPLIHFEKFDSASRGPWGAFLLILNLRSRHVVAIGAWITVLAVAIDPFTQQLIHSVSCNRHASVGSARIPRAINLTMIDLGFSGDSYAMIDGNMLSAVQFGLLNGTNSVNFECTSGNCTFPEDSNTAAMYQSIAIDSLCIDVSNELQYIHPVGWQIPKIGNKTWLDTITWAKTFGGFPRTLSEDWPQDIDEHPIFEFVPMMLMVDDECKKRPRILIDSPCLKGFAAQCRFWPSVQTLNSRIELFQLKEEILRSQPLRRSGVYWDWVLPVTDTLRNASWESCTASDTPTSTNLVPIFGDSRFSLRPVLDFPDPKWYPEDCVFTMANRSSDGIATYLTNIFDNKTLSGPYGIQQGNTTEGEIWLKEIWHDGKANISTINAFAKRVANAMTVAVRNSPIRNQKWGFIEGVATSTNTCIEVRWIWLAFPTSLIVLTIAFLRLTIWKTAKQRHPSSKGVWKSSSLPVLFTGLSEEARSGHERSNGRSEMIDAAETLEVSLGLAEDGWRLRRDG